MAPSAGEDGVAAAARAQGPGSTKTATFPTVVLEGVTAAELFDTRSTGGIVAPAEVRRRRARAERGGDGGPGRKSQRALSRQKCDQSKKAPRRWPSLPHVTAAIGPSAARIVLAGACERPAAARCEACYLPLSLCGDG